jgi:hypothetical protein
MVYEEMGLGEVSRNLRCSRQDYEDYCLLGCYTVQGGGLLPSFQQNLLPPAQKIEE